MKRGGNTMRRLRYLHELMDEIRAVLAIATQPMTDRAIATAIRRRGVTGDVAGLSWRIRDALSVTPGLGVRVGVGWMRPQQPQPQTKNAEDDEHHDDPRGLLLNERRSAAASAAWRRPRQVPKSQGGIPGEKIVY
jgi:hypothetical protein